jgi:hypothetical protein
VEQSARAAGERGVVAQIAEISWHVAGDIGGVGVSRFWFVRQDAASITGSNANAAAAASRLVLNGAAGVIPSPITWTCDPQVNIYESTSGLVQGPLVLSSVPAAVAGSGGSNFPAGTGARVNWKTATLQGRRLIRGAVFIVPLAGVAFGANGSLQATQVSNINAGAASYLTAMTTALLYPVVWHRPAKATFTGGTYGIVFAGITSSTPAGLRSRRS